MRRIDRSFDRIYTVMLSLAISNSVWSMVWYYKKEDKKFLVYSKPQDSTVDENRTNCSNME